MERPRKGRTITIILMFVLANVFSFSKIEVAKADGCGGTVVCHCGDTVTSDYTLSDDLICPGGSGLVSGANNITIDGGGHKVETTNASPGLGLDILNDGATINDITIRGFANGILAEANNVVIKDSTLENNTYGVNSSSNSGLTVRNSSFTLNSSGINFMWSDNLEVDSNAFIKNKYGISNASGAGSTDINIHDNSISKSSDYGLFMRVGLGDNPVIENNRLFLNHFDIYHQETSLGEDISSNQFIHNTSSQAINDFSMTRNAEVGGTVAFSLTMKDQDYEDCPNCTYEVTAYPEDGVNTSKAGAELSGSFIPANEGTESLLFKITDPAGNFTERKYSVLVGETVAEQATYYYSPDTLENGTFGYTADRSFKLSAPTSSESWSGVGLNHRIGEIVNYPFSRITSIDNDIWYKCASISDFYYINSEPNDYETTVQSIKSNYTNIKETISGLNWITDYLVDWYQINVSLNGRSDNDPYVETSEANPSTITVHYEHSKLPKIRGLSDNNIILLSATKNDDGSYKIIYKNPLASTVALYSTYDELSSPFTEGESTISSIGENQFQMGLSGEEIKMYNTASMTVVPSSGSVSVELSEWNTSGNYKKSWQESSDTHDLAVEHTVGGNKANTLYDLTVDGQTIGVYQTDSDGSLSFIYNGGFSTKTFSLTESSSSSPTSTSTTSAVTILPETGSG